MIKSLSMMNNVVEICDGYRKRIFGNSATAKDFKDSFVINKCVEDFDGKPEELMDEKITEMDQGQMKMSKSVNFRSDCYEKVSTYSKLLHIPDSEVCRRILYYMRDADNEVSNPVQFAALKSKAALLQTQMEACMKTMCEILKEIDELERL